MIIPVVYGKAVVKPLPVYRHDGESASYFAYVACENQVQSIKLYANGSEYDRYNVSYQGSVEHQMPDGTVLSYPHVNSILAEYPASVFEELGSSEIDVQCFCDGSVIYDLVSKETVASYNPVNFIYDFMTSTKYGMGIQPDMLSLDAFELEALYAEHYDLINTCAFGVVLDSESTTENLNKLLLHANAELFNSEGLIHIAIKRQRPVSADISQFVVKGSVRFKQGTLSDTVGRVRITTHTVPEWNTMQAVIDSELDYAANEEAVEYDYIEDLELPLVFARHKMDRTNYNDTVELEIAHMGLILDPCDVVNLDYSDYDLNGRYLVKSVSYPTPFTVGLVLLPDPVSLYDNVEGNFSEGVYSVYDSTLSAPEKITNINISETVETLADGSYLIVLTASWLSAERASSYSVTVINGGISQSLTTKGLTASFRVVPGSASVSVSSVSYSNVFADAYSVSYDVSGTPVAPVNVSNLTYELIRSGIRLSWLKSASLDVLRYDIYVADVFYVSVSSTEYVYPVTAEGTFTFNIFTVARSGIKSSGASISVTIQKPATPTALTTTPKLYSIGLDAVFTKDSLFDGLEIWAGTTNSRSAAEHLATVQTGKYDHSNLDLVAGFYYWIRVRNIFGLASEWYPFSASVGVFGQTDSDPSKLLDTLKESVGEDQLLTTLKTRIDKIDTGAFVYKSGVYKSGVFGGMNAAFSGLFERYESNQSDMSDIFTSLSRNLNSIEALQSDIASLTSSNYVSGEDYIIGNLRIFNSTVYRCIENDPQSSINPNLSDKWEPADALSTLVSEISSTVDELAVLVESKVSRTVFDSLFNTVSSNVTSIAQHSESIALKAEKTELAALANDVEYSLSQIQINTNNIKLSAEAITGTLAYGDGVYKSGVYVKTPAAYGGLNGLGLSYRRAQLTLDEHDGILLRHETMLNGTSGLLNKFAVAEQNISALQNADGSLQSQINSKVQIETFNSLFERVGIAEESIDLIVNEVGDIIAEWTVKTDVNGKVAGVGLMNTGVLSEFAVLADAFSVALSSEDEDPVRAFIMGLINGSAAVGINGDLFIDGSVSARAVGTNLLITNSANIADAVITDAHISALSADKIHAGTLDANNVEIINIAGENIKVTSLIKLTDGGKLILGNDNIVFDTAGSGSGIATFAPDGGISGQHYMTLNNGDIQFYYFDAINGRHVEYKSLRRMESGTAFNNNTVNIDGVWKRQPKIMLSPANLQSYDGNYSGQDQSFLLDVTNISVANGRYSFVPRAQLVLAANVITSVYNLTASNSSNSVTFASTAVGSPGNTVKIRASVKLASVRSSGTTGIYMYRNVIWRIVAGSYVTGWRTVGLGTTLDYVADAQELAVVQGQYSVTVEAQAYDAGATFSTGGTQYEQWSGVSDYMDKDQHPVIQVGGIYGSSKQAILPDLYVPAGYDVVRVDWELRYGTSGSSGTWGSLDCVGMGTESNRFISLGQPLNSVKTFTTPGWNGASPTVVFTASSEETLTVQGIKATVSAQKVITNSTTPANSLILEVVTYDVAGAVMLAEGSINWWAIGE